MKKTYIQPEALVVNFQTEGMIAVSMKISDTTVDTSDEGVQLTNKQNGPWESSPWE